MPGILIEIYTEFKTELQTFSFVRRQTNLEATDALSVDYFLIILFVVYMQGSAAAVLATFSCLHKPYPQAYILYGLHKALKKNILTRKAKSMNTWIETHGNWVIIVAYPLMYDYAHMLCHIRHFKKYSRI